MPLMLPPEWEFPGDKGGIPTPGSQPPTGPPPGGFGGAGGGGFFGFGPPFTGQFGFSPFQLRRLGQFLPLMQTATPAGAGAPSKSAPSACGCSAREIFGP